MAAKPTPTEVTVLICLFSLVSLDFALRCGKQHIRKSPLYIVGGKRTYYGEFPWVHHSVWRSWKVNFFGKTRSGKKELKCGGSILDKRWILTAAHCINVNERPEDFEVNVKSYELNPSNGGVHPVKIRVEKIIKHDDFGTPMPLSNDIALMKLAKDIEFDDYAWPICLPSPFMNVTGKVGVVAGWGHQQHKGNFSEYQMKVAVPIISSTTCDSWYSQSGYKYHETEKSQLCAGYEEGLKDSCAGDSGGPLFVKMDGHYTQVGIVSFAVGCAEPKLPGVYARVSSYSDWIISKMKEN